ncbi:MAG TPA: hypothetical protein VF921_17910, partial [Vicinamibacterales bacterium]
AATSGAGCRASPPPQPRIQRSTYVYDGSGEKLRTVQFKGASLLTPNSLFFTKNGRVLVTPGCDEFGASP